MIIDELHFSVRVYNCLRRARIDTVEQLERMSDKDLMSLRNFGVACLAEVRQKVAGRREIEKPTMTNGERVRAMTDEELAVFLNSVEVCLSQPLEKCRMADHAFCVACTLRWLQQPAEVQEK